MNWRVRTYFARMLTSVAWKVGRYTKSYSRTGKCGAISHNSAIYLKALFTEAADQRIEFMESSLIRSHDRSVFLRACHAELFIAKVSHDEEMLKHQHRLCTYYVRMPSNGNIYICLTSSFLRCSSVNGFVQYIIATVCIAGVLRNQQRNLSKPISCMFSKIMTKARIWVHRGYRKTKKMSLTV